MVDFNRIVKASDYELMDAIGEREALLVEAEDYVTPGRKAAVARELNHLIFEIDCRNKEDAQGMAQS